MTVIAKCEAIDCVHNKEDECLKDVVTINLGWECDDYEESEFEETEDENKDDNGDET